MIPISLTDIAFQTNWQDASAKALARIERIRSEDCPRCDGPSCPVALACTSRGSADSSGRDDGVPMCKWAAQVVSGPLKSPAARARILTSRGMTDPKILDIVSAASSMPVPSASLFASDADRQVHASAREHVQSFIDRRDRDLLAIVLTGITGSGKSMLAAYACAESKSCAWLSATEASSWQTWDAALKRGRPAELNVIDDLGRERETEGNYAIEMLTEYIAWRCDRGLRTIATTNLSGGSFAKRYTLEHGRLLSRMKANGRWVDTGKTDLRAAGRRTDKP